MPDLSKEQLAVMASYPLDTNDERLDTHIVPGTDDGDFPDMACWNWALTGGTHNNKNKTTPDEIYSRIVEVDFYADPVWPLMLGRSLRNTFPNSSTELEVIKGQFNLACLKLTAASNFHEQKNNEKILHARRQVMRALLRIAAQKNGLTPTKSTTRYTLWMRTDMEEWWSWHHWAIGVDLPDKRTSIVQTVPGNGTDGALYHACKDMWDAGLDGTEFVYLAGLLDSHIEFLNRIKAYKKPE